MKPGDLVRLTKNYGKVIPGALTAIKFFKRLKAELDEESMLVLKIIDNSNRPNSKSALVLVKGYKKVINTALLEVINEERRQD